MCELLQLRFLKYFMFPYRFPTVFITNVAIGLTIISCNNVSQADLAKNITVKITGHSNGSGVIFEQQGNVYSVLTNHHVVPIDTGYEIQTYDDKKHRVISRLEIPGLDLAIVQFKSNQSYAIANLGNSDNLYEQQTIFVTGFPGEQTDIDIIDGKIRSIRQEIVENPEAEKGYALIYTNQTLPGSSGGAVLDANGDVIAINGRMEIDPTTGRDISRGIPINLFSEIKEEALIEANNAQTSIFDRPAIDNPTPNNLPSISPPPEENISTSLPLADESPNLINHEGSVNSVAVSENYFVSGGADNKIKVWNLETEKLERTLSGHSASVWSVAISANTVISGSSDKTIKVWNLETGELERTLSGHLDSVWSVAISGNQIVSGSKDKTIKVWNLATGELERTIAGHDAPINTVVVSGDRIISGGKDKTIKVWNLQTGDLERTFSGHSAMIWSVIVSGDQVISGSSDKTIKIWNLVTGELERTLTGHEASVHSVAISGDKIVSGSKDNTIKVWNRNTGELEQTLSGHSNAVWSVAVIENQVISGSKDRTVKLWSLGVGN